MGNNTQTKLLPLKGRKGGREGKSEGYLGGLFASVRLARLPAAVRDAEVGLARSGSRAATLLAAAPPAVHHAERRGPDGALGAPQVLAAAPSAVPRAVRRGPARRLGAVVHLAAAPSAVRLAEARASHRGLAASGGVLAATPAAMPDAEGRIRLGGLGAALVLALLPAPVGDAERGPPDGELEAAVLVLAAPAGVRGAVGGGLGGELGAPGGLALRVVIGALVLSRLRVADSYAVVATLQAVGVLYSSLPTHHLRQERMRERVLVQHPCRLGVADSDVDALPQERRVHPCPGTTQIPRGGRHFPGERRVGRPRRSAARCRVGPAVVVCETA
eukprot:1180858-Prorocentrum_minimum.AAC.2